MPSVDRLQRQRGDDRFEVVALSLDHGDAATVRKFYEQANVRSIDVVFNETERASRELGIVGMPATLLINGNGQEVAQLHGPAEWDTRANVE